MTARVWLEQQGKRTKVPSAPTLPLPGHYIPALEVSSPNVADAGNLHISRQRLGKRDVLQVRVITAQRTEARRSDRLAGLVQVENKNTGDPPHTPADSPASGTNGTHTHTHTTTMP